MLEPPSSALLTSLKEFRLCTRADLRRCRRRVRKLAHDLPAFDSVWIDALQQLRRITPFQAKMLQSPHPQQLAIGPCVLLDQLGSGGESQTYLARVGEQSQRCVLKSSQLPLEFRDAALLRLQETVERLRGFHHRSLVAPHSALLHQERLVTLSRVVTGPHLGELLVRRGRFASADVIAIARQLIDALAEFELRKCVHGDIRLINVRLTCKGDAVLVDSGFLPAVQPELTILARRHPDRYDGVAPELIGTGQTADSRSEMYALGSLLWQLLAGRPPFPTGDPLAKLAQHQTREIEDVREWAPDTPPVLADSIRTLTTHDAEHRPQSFADLREIWGRPRAADRRRLSWFHSRLRFHATNRLARGRLSTGWRWSLTAASLLVLSGLAVTLFDAGLRNRLLEIAAPVTDYVRQTAERLSGDSPTRDGERDTATADRRSSTSPDRPGIPVPPPDADGVIVLGSDGPYSWETRLDAVGSLTLRAAPGRRPTVIIDADHCRIAADEVRLENIQFTLIRAAKDRPTKSFIRVRAQNLLVTGCSFRFSKDRWRSRYREPPTSRSPDIPAVISWTINDSQDRSGGRLLLRDCLCYGSADIVAVAIPPAVIDCRNCLQLGRGSLLRFKRLPPRGRDCRLQLSHVTLRQSTSLLSVVVNGRLRTGRRRLTAFGTITVNAEDCVFDLAGEKSALARFRGEFGNVDSPLVRMTGVGSLARPDLTVAVRDGAMRSGANRSGTDVLRWVQLDGGIITAPYRFVGSLNGDPRNSAIADHRAPRRSSGSPGVDINRLPLPAVVPAGTTAVSAR